MSAVRRQSCATVLRECPIHYGSSQLSIKNEPAAGACLFALCSKYPSKGDCMGGRHLPQTKHISRSPGSHYRRSPQIQRVATEEAPNAPALSRRRASPCCWPVHEPDPQRCHPREARSEQQSLRLLTGMSMRFRLRQGRSRCTETLRPRGPHLWTCIRPRGVPGRKT